MLPSRVGHVRRGIVVVHDDVGGEAGPRVVAFDQIVRQQRVLGKATVGRELESVYIVDAFAGKAAFAVQILIHIGSGRGVRVDSGMP